MTNLINSAGLWSLIYQFEREIPTKDAFVAKWLKDTPEDRKDIEYVAVVTDVYNINTPESMRVKLNEQAIRILLEYIDSYSSIHQKFEPKVADMKSEQSYGKRIMKTLPLIPAIVSHSRKTHELKRQTYQRLVGVL